MIDIRVGDLWGYCDIDAYVVTQVYTKGGESFVSLVDIQTDKYHESYPKYYFERTFENTDKYMWKLLSRPSAGLVEQ